MYAVITSLLVITAKHFINTAHGAIDPDLLTTGVVYPEDFVCLGNDAKTIKFKNNPDVVVPPGEDSFLPQVRLMIGSYGSQFALHYIPFMFMREILGMNVTFAPTIDPAKGWAAVSAGYPDYYWSWLENDENDICFEFWPQQAALVNDGEGPVSYYQTGAVDFGGFVGTFGEISLYVPKYLVDEYPSIIVPEVLKTSSQFQELLINGSKNGTAGLVYSTYFNSTEAFDGNYLEYFARKYDYYINKTGFTRGNNGFGQARESANGNSYRFYDDPGNGKPTFWGTVASYAQSQTANNLTRNIFNGTVNFACFESEGTAAEIYADLYARRQPFVANIYTPDFNFGIRDPKATDPDDDLQKWEKIAFARNPDQSIESPCYLAETCQYPVNPIMKIANPRLAERFPEAYQFFQSYQITATSVNKLLSYYLDLENAGLHDSERWLNASCQWLKNEEDTWNNRDWLINVTRYDCLEGCGVTGSNGVTRGGRCDYLTGQCVCDHTELEFSDTCDASCPGLVFVEDGFETTDDNGNSTMQYFKFCGGHGTCKATGLCDCQKGYGDSTNPNKNGCTKAYSVYQFDTALAVVFITFSSLLCIGAIGCIVWLRTNASYKTVKALSVDMTTLMTAGLVMIAASNIALVSPVSSAACISWQWLFGLGGILAIMSPLLKAYRVSRVFHGGKMLRAVKITDKMLMQMLIKAALIEVLICGAYTFAHEFFGGTTQFYNDEQLRVEAKCNESESQITNYFFLGSLAYFFVMLCALTYYSYGTRRALSVFQESTCAYMSSFLSLFCALISFVFSLATDDPMFRASVQASAIVIVVTAVLVLFFGVRICKFYREPENRNVTDMRVGATTGTTSYSSKNLGPSNEQQNFARPGPA